MKAMYYRAYLLAELSDVGCVYPNLSYRLENRDTEFNTQMRDTSTKRCDRMKIINDWFCDKSVEENSDIAKSFGSALARKIRTDWNGSEGKDESQFKILFKMVLSTIKQSEVVTRDAVKILRKVTFRIRQFDEGLIATNNDRAARVFNGGYSTGSIPNEQKEENLGKVLPEDIKTRLTESGNKIIKIVEDHIGVLEYFDRINDCGNWTRTTDPNGIKLGYLGHRNAVVQPTGDITSNKMKYGFELEGAMTNANFQLAMTKMSKTPFDGGFILDKRNGVMATEDASLPRDTGVEFVFAPFEYEKGQRFGKAVEDILAEYGFRRTTASKEGGVHCHLDANKFETIGNIEAFHNKVYDMSLNDKLSLYKRDSNRYCTGRKDGNVRYEDRGIALEGQFTKDNKQLGYLDKVFSLIRDHSFRYYLINYEHVKFADKSYVTPSSGTIELRGFYAEKLLTDAAKDIKEKLLTGIVKGEYL